MEEKESVGIIRVYKTKSFSVIPNAAMSDERLSFGARGILAYLLTKPDTWQVNTKNLVGQSKSLAIPSKAGRTAILRMLKELEICGYLVRKRIKLKDGTFSWISSVYEAPQSGYPITGNLTTYKELNKVNEVRLPVREPDSNDYPIYEHYPHDLEAIGAEAVDMREDRFYFKEWLEQRNSKNREASQ